MTNPCPSIINMAATIYYNIFYNKLKACFFQYAVQLMFMSYNLNRKVLITWW